MPRRKQAYLSDVLGLRNFQRCWALVPTSETTDTRKYIEILEKYFRPSVPRYFGNHAITIQHDTTPCHVSRKMYSLHLLYEHDHVYFIPHSV